MKTARPHVIAIVIAAIVALEGKDGDNKKEEINTYFSLSPSTFCFVFNSLE
jgi:hypothetical protein